MNDSESGVYEGRTSRRSFLRKFGTTLAIGLGVGLVPATNAFACTTKCCTNSSCTGCPQGQVGKLCQNCCPTCCACFNASDPTCVSNTGGQCPC
jgi:hypothetical protein